MLVCDGDEKGDLGSTTKGIVTLAGQFCGILEEWLFTFRSSEDYN